MVPKLFLAFDDLKDKPSKTTDVMMHLSNSGEEFGIKFNLDAMLCPSKNLWTLVKQLREFKQRLLFADLKMWNGSRTMEATVKEFVNMGVDFINVWAHADKQMAKAVKAAEGSATKILGLTVLSHDDDAYCQKWYKRTMREAVVDFSRYAVEAGCYGVIVPGTMLGAAHWGSIKVATGVRPDWYKDDRHAQEATPTELVRGNANFAVCGSPVLKQITLPEKIEALRRIIMEMRAAELALRQ